MKTSDIKDAELRFYGERPAINFKTDECNYHFWLRKESGIWMIDGSIYKRLFIDNRMDRTVELNPNNKVNSPIVKFVMETVDVTKIDKLLSELKVKRDREWQKKVDELNKKVVSDVRSLFKKLSKTERVNHLKIAFDVLANHPDDDKLLAVVRRLNKICEKA
jgi:hypothetical protein